MDKVTPEVQKMCDDVIDFLVKQSIDHGTVISENNTIYLCY
jgi:hypothetical protein